MAEQQISFGNLYNYVTGNGTVIPQTSDIKAVVEDAFDAIFGGEVSRDPSTPMGRFIEAITLLFTNVCAVNAQTGNFLNPDTATGTMLDLIGRIFGIDRQGMSDAELRAAILSGQSRGVGFAESVTRAILASATPDNPITHISVLNNGEADPQVLPNAEVGVAVEPHSLFICVGGGDDMKIATAIRNTISAGCALTQKGFSRGQKVSVEFSDTTITFYRPEVVSVEFDVAIRNDSYTGDDLRRDVANAIRSYTSERGASQAISASDVIAAVVMANIGVSVREVTMLVGGVEQGVIIAHPNQEVDFANADVEVTIA